MPPPSLIRHITHILRSVTIYHTRNAISSYASLETADGNTQGAWGSAVPPLCSQLQRTPHIKTQARCLAPSLARLTGEPCAYCGHPIIASRNRRPAKLLCCEDL